MGLPEVVRLRLFCAVNELKRSTISLIRRCSSFSVPLSLRIISTWKNEIGSGVCSMCGGEEVWNVSFVPGHEAEKAEAKAGTDGVEVKATTAAAVGSGSADKAASTGTTASTLPMDTSETAAASTGKEEVAETDLLSFSDDGQVFISGTRFAFVIVLTLNCPTAEVQRKLPRSHPQRYINSHLQSVP